MAKYLLTGVETEKLRFRKIVPTDFQTWLSFHKDPSSTTYWKGLPKDPIVAFDRLLSRVFERYKKGWAG